MPKKKSPPKKQPVITAEYSPKLLQNFRRIIEQLVHGKSYNPLSLREIMEKLHLPEQHLDPLNAALESHVDDGLLSIAKGRYTLKKLTAQAITGVIRVHMRGFGFVKPDDPSTYDEDIFVPKHLTMNAVDGDHVEVQVNAEVSEKGPEGKVTAILSRNRTHVAGVILSSSRYGEIEAYVPLFGPQKRVLVQSTPDTQLKKGDRVVLKVLEWGSRDSDTICELSHVIGHISDPSCDIKAAIEEFGLKSTFSTKATKEAESHGNRVSAAAIAEREDLRGLECVTIDPETAKDFDDAITLTKTRRGQYQLGVHIADVSHYVTSGSALDKEAKLRCNSTYFPGFCLPMLPPGLSENLCSLKPGVNRLTVSIFINFDKSGNLLNYRIAKTVIKSSRRFTYREAKEVLDGKKKSKHLPLLELMVELCGVLKVKRAERGSIEFMLPDLEIKIDPQGMPTGTEYVTYDITHQMIEEFMLKANELVAMHLTKQGKGVAYRVHDEPSEDSMKDFCALANAFGFNLKEKASAKELQDFFDEALQTSFGPYLATSYIRCMRQALYSPENIGHYGLGLTHYCHFTSPIRRYVDLVIHRAIFEKDVDGRKLEAITRDCSDQERNSAKAESNVLLLKKLRLLDHMQKEDPQRQFEAVVTRVKPFGFSFEILEFLLEGFFHVSELDGDYFLYEDTGRILRGRHTGATFFAGERIFIMLNEVDFIRLESKWHFVSGQKNEEKPRTKKGFSSKKTKGKASAKGPKPTHKPHHPGQQRRKRK